MDTRKSNIEKACDITLTSFIPNKLTQPVSVPGLFVQL
jgi:hypothetical protein